MPVGLQAKRQYVEDELAGLSPVQLLIKLYDVAIASCARGDRRRLSQALVQLISSLNFEHHDISFGVFRLLNFCLRQTHQGRFEEVKPILVGLRAAWVQAEPKMRQEAAARPVAVGGGRSGR
jgi:flagellin-specific chaperone FliS